MEEDYKATESLLYDDRDMIMIQYMDSSMAEKLLRKFPDYSAFDFDYSQSSIWSPLVPRFHSLSCLEQPRLPNLKRKLEFGNDCKVFDKMPLSKLKKKICNFGLNVKSKIGKKRKMKAMGVNPSEKTPPSRKGWKKVLKMTTKQFKKKRDHHHHHHSIADYFQSPISS